MFLISIGYPVGEEIARDMDTGVLMLLRFVFAALFFAPVVAYRYGLSWPGFRSLGRYSLISLSLVGFFWCMFAGLRTTSALNTGAISTLIPGFTAIVGAGIVGERIGGRRIAALGVGLIGTLWVVFKGDWDRFIRLELNEGDLLVFLGCISMGFYSPLVSRLHRGEPVMIMTFWVVIIGAIWFALISNTALWSTHWDQISGGTLAGVIYLALFSTTISFFLVQTGTIKIGPTRVQTYSYLIPTFVLFIDWAFGKGWPSAMTLPGIAIVFMASLVIQRGIIGLGQKQTP